MVDPAVPESCYKWTDTVKGLREGRTNSTTQDDASLECNMTRPDESPREVRPLIDHLLTAERNTRIGTWNVRTMHQTGEAAQVAHETKKYNILVLGLIETRWNGAGQTKLATGEHMIYSGYEDEGTHTHGVAIMATQSATIVCMECVTKNHYSKIQVNGKACSCDLVLCSCDLVLCSCDLVLCSCDLVLCS